MLLKAKADSHIGAVRNVNQDSYICDESNKLFLLADGMGGHVSGEVASLAAVRAAYEFMKLHAKGGGSEGVTFPQLLGKATFAAHEEVRNKNIGTYGRNSMGTTLIVSAELKGCLFFSSVGDSHVYSINRKDGNASLTLESQAHTPVDELIRRGLPLTFIDAGQKHTLTQAVGLTGAIIPDLGKIDLSNAEAVILCSDGLYNMIDQDEMLEIYDACWPAVYDFIDVSISRAIQRGGYDNITVILLWRE